MQNSEGLEKELKELIIHSLMLEDVTPEDIQSEEPLFVEGLGLDSIDALELAIALENQYGVKIEDNPEENRKIFMSVQSLAEYVGTHRSK